MRDAVGKGHLLRSVKRGVWGLKTGHMVKEGAEVQADWDLFREYLEPLEALGHHGEQEPPQMRVPPRSLANILDLCSTFLKTQVPENPITQVECPMLVKPTPHGPLLP